MVWLDGSPGKVVVPVNRGLAGLLLGATNSTPSEAVESIGKSPPKFAIRWREENGGEGRGEFGPGLENGRGGREVPFCRVPRGRGSPGREMAAGGLLLCHQWLERKINFNDSPITVASDVANQMDNEDKYERTYFSYCWPNYREGCKMTYEPLPIITPQFTFSALLLDRRTTVTPTNRSWAIAGVSLPKAQELPILPNIPERKKKKSLGGARAAAATALGNFGRCSGAAEASLLHFRDFDRDVLDQGLGCHRGKTRRHSHPKVRPVRRYDKSYRRFTWHNEVRNNLSILSVRRSAPDGKCSYYSIIAALEANLRIHHGFGHNLSIKYLQRKDKKVKIEKLLKDFDKKKRKIGRNVRIMDILRRTGVPTEEGYDLFCQAGLPCEMKRIQCYTMYDVKKPSQIRLALERHLIKGPMVAVFYISGLSPEVRVKKKVTRIMTWKFVDISITSGVVENPSANEYYIYGVLLNKFSHAKDLPLVAFFSSLC
uniref:Uncharacterized protein n=1 Tax=Oryza brachyantha TaxID=4533 RepID=J3MHB9_ORYBR